MNRLIKNVLAVIVVSLMCVPIITAGGKRSCISAIRLLTATGAGKEFPLAVRLTRITSMGTAICISAPPITCLNIQKRITNSSTGEPTVTSFQTSRPAGKRMYWYQSDVLSILVGINDLNVIHDNGTRFLDTAKFERQYRDIIERSLKQNPNLTIVLGEPFLFPVGIWNSDYPHWRAQCELMASIVRKLSKEYNTIFLPYQSLFDSLATDPKTPLWNTGCGMASILRQPDTKRWLKCGSRLWVKNCNRIKSDSIFVTHFVLIE